MTAYETSSLLAGRSGVRHGFFGRAGGISTGEFAELNVSTSVGDAAEAVDENRRAVSAAIGAGPLLLLKQTHSTRVHIATEPIAPGTVDADAMVTATPGLSLGILTADCTPILLLDPDAGVIGGAHAGWRGAVDGVIGRTVEAMKTLGADPRNILAAYGPTIHAANYEVGERFRDDFLALHPTGAGHFHTPAGGQPHFDLPGFVAEQLRSAGIGQIDQVGGCTYAHPDRYFSHRYATHHRTRTGRQVAVIGMM